MDVLSALEGRSTLRESVLERVRQAIIQGSFPPGTEINQAQIARQLGISRGPVREAFGQLEQDGLIRNLPYRGFYVTSLTPEYARELYSIRRILETFAVTYAVEALQPPDIERLDGIVEAMRRAAQANDSVTLGVADADFHFSIIQMARHKLLLQSWKAIDIGVRRFLYLRHRIYPDLNEVVGSHPKIVAALATRDKDAACALIETHIVEAGAQILGHWPADHLPAEL
jgi:DNA-binding GntR family transcriptional regulator